MQLFARIGSCSMSGGGGGGGGGVPNLPNMHSR
jgi:hypothetical protein